MEEDLQCTQEVNSQMSEMHSQPTTDQQKDNAVLARGRLISLNPRYESIDLCKDDLLLGRQKACDVRLTDVRISGKHCRIFKVQSQDKKLTKESFYIEDLSSNGTFVNGTKIGKGNRTMLQDGDRISLVSKKRTSMFMSYIFEDLSVDIVGNENDEFFKYYDLKQELGRGNFSTVKLGINKKTGEQFAIKIINKKKFWHLSKSREQILREIEILKRVKHPNIISYIDIFDSDYYVYLVLELAKGGELFDKIAENGACAENEAKHIFKQLVDAINYLHSNGIAHRDLKPENILISRPYDSSPIEDLQIKLADFGLARFIDERLGMTTLCGTPQYVAPEVIKQGTASLASDQAKQISGYGKAVDMWSLGVILYILLSGEPPFDEDNDFQLSLFEQIEKGIYHFPPSIWKDISPLAQDLVRRLLIVDPSQRLTATETLQHPWLQNETSSIPKIVLDKAQPFVVPTHNSTFSYLNGTKDNILSRRKRMFVDSQCDEGTDVDDNKENVARNRLHKRVKRSVL
jgi:serine/threonine-protein kinase Chk2